MENQLVMDAPYFNTAWQGWGLKIDMPLVKTKRRVEEYKKYGLKNPRCMGIYPQT